MPELNLENHLLRSLEANATIQSWKVQPIQNMMAPNNQSQEKNINRKTRKYKKPEIASLSIPDVSLEYETSLSELPQIQEETINDFEDN